MTLPPASYAGTERVVYNLTEGLQKRGHDVTLFSVGDSETSAKLVSIFPHPLGLQEHVSAKMKESFYPLMHVAEGFRRQDEFDIIHSHAQFLGLPFGSVAKTPSLHTFHRTFTGILKDEEDLVKQFGYLNFTSISDAQRVPGVNYLATVYNGIDVDKFKPAKKPSRDYLFWGGRLVDKKGVLEAIAVAKNLNYPLILAGKITEEEFFTTRIKPEINSKLVKFHNDANQDEMIQYYQHAKVTLMPAKWNEPFGLTTIESMSCGAPVVAYANGGVRETIKDGVTGFLVNEKDGVHALTEKTKQILDMSEIDYKKMSNDSREYVLQKFSIEKMIDGYEAVYERLLTA